MKERKNKFIKEKHVAYKRIVDDSRVAVLCIHGFMGSPNQYRDIVPQIPQNISVYNMILDGHGGTPLDFGGTSMKKWEQNVEDAISELLQNHEEIYILSHSMGSLFAIEQAINNPKIAK
jgi:carboxylesterase